MSFVDRLGLTTALPGGGELYDLKETQKLLDDAEADATSGPITGLFNIVNGFGSGGGRDVGKYDRDYQGEGASNEVASKDQYTIKDLWGNPRQISAGEFGNYAAGYAGAAYDMKNPNGNPNTIVSASNIMPIAGQAYHELGMSHASSTDRHDVIGKGWIEYGRIAYKNKYAAAKAAAIKQQSCKK